MIPTANLVAFGLTAIPLVIVPGPSVLFTIVELLGAVYIVFLGIQAIGR